MGCSRKRQHRLLKGGLFLVRSYYVVDSLFSEYSLHSLHQKSILSEYLNTTQEKTVMNDMKQLEVGDVTEVK